MITNENYLILVIKELSKRLFFLAYRDRGGANRVRAGSYRRCFLPTVKIENYNIEIDGRNFYD